MYLLNAVRGGTGVSNCSETTASDAGDEDRRLAHQARVAGTRSEIETLVSARPFREGRRELFHHLSIPEVAAKEARLLQPGDRLDGTASYVVDAFLARGGMAEVYRGHRDPDGRSVAIKLLPAQYLGDASMLRRFQEEQDTVRRIEKHRNVVETFDFGERSGHMFIVMELAMGWPQDTVRILDLSARRKPIPVREVLTMAVQIGSALHHIHAHKVIHRDLKSANLLLFDPDTVKLADSGVARPEAHPHLTLTGMFVGTLAYMSPEHTGRPEELRPVSDLYSLGVILYEMATGALPFHSDAPWETMFLHRDPTLRPEPPSRKAPAIPGEVEQYILRLLEKKPADRFASALEAAEAARRLIESRLEEPAAPSMDPPGQS